MSNRIVGLDLDNTLIDYSKSVERYSLMHLDELCTNIFQIRGVLKRDNGTNNWQKAQVWIYTEGLKYAKLSGDAKNLLERLSRDSIPVFIVSHKTSRTPKDLGYLDLRGPARDWLKQHVEPLGIDLKSIYFESSRIKKIQRVIDLKITHFVDDLIEVLTDENFPISVQRYLYDPYFLSADIDPSIEIIHRLDQL